MFSYHLPELDNVKSRSFRICLLCILYKNIEKEVHLDPFWLNLRHTWWSFEVLFATKLHLRLKTWHYTCLGSNRNQSLKIDVSKANFIALPSIKWWETTIMEQGLCCNSVAFYDYKSRGVRSLAFWTSKFVRRQKWWKYFITSCS